MPRVSRLAVAVVALLLLAGGAQALARTVDRAPRMHRGMTAQQIRKLARANRVIVVLKRQQRGRLATTASVNARKSAQARQRRPLIAGIARSGGAVTREYTVLNAFAARVSNAEKARLASDPSVASVVPDAFIAQAPQPATPAPSNGTPSPGNPTTPQSGTCPTDPGKPLLEPEALQTMHVAYADPSIPQAQSLATGKGVKVAFFADGLDINNPDFIRADGSHVFVDYRDFTGDGPNAPTGGEEAFGDATDIAAQGRQVYDVANFVNPAHPVAPGCTITVRGVAPGASLIGMKVFGDAGAFASTLVQGIDWAVTQDHADVLSESFGDFTMPDTARDVVKQFNDAAVRAGIVVSQGSSDSGATAGPSEPATDPLVMDSGGSTNFRQYAQTTSYGFQFTNGTWLNDNISSIAGGGFSQNASSPDFVSPAESDWALCTPNKTLYSECADFKADPFNGAPASIEAFGGTSQSTPLDAGVAALVIQAYRNTHRGHSPAPALVKQIIQSTANDLGMPNEEQGAGEVDGLKAVQEAMSVDGGTPTGHGLLFDPAKLTITQPAGTSDSETVAVTNTGAATQTVSAHARALTQVVSDTKQDVTLGTTPTFVDQFGHPRPYVMTTFNVPANVDRLLVSDAWPGPNTRIGVTLIDPTKAFAAFTRPQGNGDHGQVDVRKPVAGTWTALVFVRDATAGTTPYSGVVHLEFATQRFGSVDSVSPSSLTLRSGQTGRFQYRTRLPSSPGDSGHDLVISDSSGDQTVVPVVLRSLIPVDGHGGTFAGTLYGGNGREFVAQENTFAFDVPPGRKALSVKLAFPDDANTQVIGTLNDPNGDQVGSQSTFHPELGANGTFTNGLQATALSPQPGRWTFVVTVASPVGGTTLSAPYQGAVSFDPQDISARGLPNGDKVQAGQTITATIRVHNHSPATEDVFADPRLSGSETDSVLALFQATGLTMPGAATEFLVPTETDAILGVAQASRPILLEMGYFEIGEGDPDLIGQSQGNNATAFYSAHPVGNGQWGLAPSMVGPFDTAQTGTVDTGMLAHTQAFDRNVESSSGDIWRDAVDANPPDFTPLVLGPGQSGRITVTFTAPAQHGKVNGTLYVDDFEGGLDAGNEQAAFPYSYKVK